MNKTAFSYILSFVSLYNEKAVLQFLVKISDCKINKCGNAFFAALLSPQGKESGEPTIFCGIEILQYLVGLTDGKEW